MDQRRNEDSMPGSIVSSGGAAAAHVQGHVEVVQDDRIGPRATYRGQGFNLVSVDATRYRWRCSASSCPSRLVTDKFDDNHVLYSFKDHDEKEHRAVKERELSNNTCRREVVEKIGEYTYVLERTFRLLDIKCWRCQCVGCPGRCRTSVDGKTILHGPTPHTCQQLPTQEELELLRYYYSLWPPHDEPTSGEPAPAAASQGVASGCSDASVQGRQQQHMEIADSNEESCGNQVPRNTPGQPSIESDVKADSLESMGVVRGVRKGHSPLPSHTGLCSPPRPCQRSPPHPNLDATPVCAPEIKILPTPMSEREGNDVDTRDNESSKRGGDEEGEEKPQRSRSRGCRRSNVEGIASAAELLGVMSGPCACAQKKLRAAIYERVSGLLLQKEKLLKVQKRNEVRRGRLLHRLVKNGPSEAV